MVAHDWTKEGSKRRECRVYMCTTKKRRMTKDDDDEDDWGNKLTLMGRSLTLPGGSRGGRRFDLLDGVCFAVPY